MRQKKKLKTLSARQNVYGNWNIYDGRTGIHKYGERFDTVCRVMELLDTGDYLLSPRSEITIADVDAMRAALAAPARR